MRTEGAGGVGMMRVTADPVKSRTRQMHATLRRRAGGADVMGLEELRAEFGYFLDRWPLCLYCNERVTHANVSLDHRVPVARGGGHEMSNLAFICQPCNKAKGDMTEEEFKDLRLMLDRWSFRHRNPKLRDKVLTALKVSASFRIGANRRARKDR